MKTCDSGISSASCYDDRAVGARLWTALSLSLPPYRPRRPNHSNLFILRFSTKLIPCLFYFFKLVHVARRGRGRGTGKGQGARGTEQGQGARGGAGQVLLVVSSSSASASLPAP